MYWMRPFLGFHGGTYPPEMAESCVNLLLSHLLAAYTQNQALAAGLSRYQHILEQPLDRIEGVVRARKPTHVPMVLTCDEVRAILADVDGVPRLVCALLYRAGLTLLEGLDLRAKDLDFGCGQITIRQYKGQKDLVTMLLGGLLQEFLDYVGRAQPEYASDGLRPQVMLQPLGHLAEKA